MGSINRCFWFRRLRMWLRQCAQNRSRSGSAFRSDTHANGPSLYRLDTWCCTCAVDRVSKDDDVPHSTQCMDDVASELMNDVSNVRVSNHSSRCSAWEAFRVGVCTVSRHRITCARSCRVHATRVLVVGAHHHADSSCVLLFSRVLVRAIVLPRAFVVDVSRYVLFHGCTP